MLRTDPGADGNNAMGLVLCHPGAIQAWLLSLCEVSRLQSRSHSSVDAVKPPVRWKSETKKFSMLNVPGVLNFGLKGNEHRLQLEYGFMPGAYSGEGRTDGAGFSSWNWCDQAPSPVELFRRTLKPFTNGSDRKLRFYQRDKNYRPLSAGDQLDRTHCYGSVTGGSSEAGLDLSSRASLSTKAKHDAAS